MESAVHLIEVFSSYFVTNHLATYLIFIIILFNSLTGCIIDYERKVIQQLCEKQHVAWK